MPPRGFRAERRGSGATEEVRTWGRAGGRRGLRAVLRVGTVGSLGAGLQRSAREDRQGPGPMALSADLRVA